MVRASPTRVNHAQVHRLARPAMSAREFVSLHANELGGRRA